MFVHAEGFLFVKQFLFEDFGDADEEVAIVDVAGFEIAGAFGVSLADQLHEGEGLLVELSVAVGRVTHNSE